MTKQDIIKEEKTVLQLYSIKSPKFFQQASEELKVEELINLDKPNICKILKRNSSLCERTAYKTGRIKVFHSRRHAECYNGLRESIRSCRKAEVDRGQ